MVSIVNSTQISKTKYDIDSCVAVQPVYTSSNVIFAYTFISFIQGISLVDKWFHLLMTENSKDPKVAKLLLLIKVFCQRILC